MVAFEEKMAEDKADIETSVSDQNNTVMRSLAAQAVTMQAQEMSTINKMTKLKDIIKKSEDKLSRMME